MTTRAALLVIPLFSITATACNGNGAARSGTITYAAPSDELHALDLAAARDTKLRDDATEPDRFPDGRVIYVDTSVLGQAGKITVAAADGSGPMTLAAPGSTVSAFNPVVSSDGTRVAFTYYPRGFSHTFAPNDGTVVVDAGGRVVANLPGVFDPAWTPDGRLVLAGTVDIPSGDAMANPTATPMQAGIFVSSGDFTTVTKLPIAVAAPQHPAVSRDGARVAFSDGDDLWIAALDGSGLRQLTAGEHFDTHPAFSPDGKLVACHSFGLYGAGSPYNAIAVVAADAAQPITLDADTANFVLDPGAASSSSAGRVNAVQHMTWR